MLRQISRLHGSVQEAHHCSLLILLSSELCQGFLPLIMIMTNNYDYNKALLEYMKCIPALTICYPCAIQTALLVNGIKIADVRQTRIVLVSPD